MACWHALIWYLIQACQHEKEDDQGQLKTAEQDFSLVEVDAYSFNLMIHV